MTVLAAFLERLFQDGQAVVRGRPEPVDDDQKQRAVAILRWAFDCDGLERPGSALPFDEPTALRAAEWSQWACWFLVNRDEPPKVFDQVLPVFGPARSAAEHAAADLTFRYLPVVLRRARAIAAEDPLADRLSEQLRCWPLSGVLADIEPKPNAPLDFFGHDGLRLRYAERLADRQRSAWVPADDRGRAWFDLVVEAQHGRPGAWPTEPSV